MPGSAAGLAASVTLAGPPEMIRPRAPRRSAAGRLTSATTAWTPSSRMRRAMRWQYCPPALRTTIWFTGGVALAWTPQLLRLLEDLAFGLDGGRDDQLGLLQLADRLGPHRAHAGADGPDEVQRAVLREGRPEEDLLERARDADADARAARQVRVRRCHAPVIAAPGRLGRAREGRADHHGVGAGGEGLAHVAARRHAAVGDDRDVARGGDRGLHDEDVGAGFLRDLAEALGALRDRRDDGGAAALLDLADALVDQLFLDGLAVDRLDDLGGFFLAGGDDPVEHVVGVGVAREDALEVQDGEAAVATHLDGELGADDAVHGGRDDGQGVAMATELPGDVDFVGVDGQAARDERDIVEAVRSPGLAPPADPHPHVVPPGWPAIPPGPIPKYRGCPARPSLDLVQYTGHPGGCQCSRAASPPLRAGP